MVPLVPYIEKRGPTKWIRLWSRSDRTLGSSVRSVMADSVQASIIDQTLALEVTGR